MILLWEGGKIVSDTVRLFAKQSLVWQEMPFVVTKKTTNAAIMLSKYTDISKRVSEEYALEKKNNR